ncbi:MAG TPA: NAD(P)-binding domain-containing protein [Pyrinomonadaceae bacterium]|nr:NAD(P)-binding domain-containing protein [Pyrinomonadaceae bacterium]
MKFSQHIASLLAKTVKLSQYVAALLALGICWTIGAYTLGGASYIGGVPLYSWGVLGGLLILTGSGFALWDARRTRRLLEKPVPDDPDPQQQAIERMVKLRKELDPSGPEYPHPIIQTERCIACQACVEACPHDVLAMSESAGKTIATVKDRELCLEDTSCQVACPINPPVCIVINTIKRIPKRPAPSRNEQFMSEVPACYLVGDVSGNPLIKNAANEGANVINFLARELETTPPPAVEIDFDLAIIGIGPAGASAAVLARRRGLSFVGIEQGELLATIAAYPERKYVHFKPDTLEPCGGIDVTGEGAERECLLERWKDAILNCGVTVNKNDGSDSSGSSDTGAEATHVINENERCMNIKRAEDEDYFTVWTHKHVTGQTTIYKVRRVILSIGERGSPKKLGVDGEELKVLEGTEPRDKVMYGLKKPYAFRGKRIAVVGGGNSAVEAAVSLVTRRNGDQIEPRPPEEMNEVCLIIRSQLKSDIKFGNKQQLFDCIDDKLIKVYYDTSVKEILADKVVLMDTDTKKVTGSLKNDYVFALIGSDPPKGFLEQIGIKIPKESAER